MATVQGGSDIFGTLSKLHYSNKKSSYLLILSRQNILAVCQAISKKKQTHSGKDELAALLTPLSSRVCILELAQTSYPS